jgi:hypothetical protein
MSSRLLTAAGLLLGIAAIVALVVQAVQWASVPLDEDWMSAAQAARGDWRDTDAFMVEPAWDSRPRVFMSDLTYIPAAAPTWFDLAEHDRIWVLAEGDRVDDGSGHLPAPWRLVGAPRAYGTVSLSVFERVRDPTSWDVLTALGDAQVTRHFGARSERCDRRQDRRWDCPRRDRWMYVGETLQPVTNDVHRCLWAMPIERGGRLSIAFKDVPAGVLSGYLGQTLPAVRSQRGAPLTFEVIGRKGSLLRRELGIHEPGFLPWSVSGFAGGDLEFLVSSPNQLDRFFCFVARVVPDDMGADLH